MAEDDEYLELLRCVERAVLENSEVKQWQEDNMQTAQLIARREAALERSRRLYDDVHESLLECETVWKAFHQMTGRKYRDSEDEEAEEGPNAIQIVDIEGDFDDTENNQQQDGNVMDCDMSDAGLAAVKMKQSTHGCEANEEYSPPAKREVEFQKRTVNNGDITPACSMQANAHGVPRPQAPASAQSTPVTTPAVERCASPLPTAAATTCSLSAKPNANASLLTSKLKNLLCKPDSPQTSTASGASNGPKVSETGKVSTANTSHKMCASSPTPEAVNHTPEGNRKTAPKATARKQTSIRNFTQVQSKASPTEQNRGSAPGNTEPKTSSEKNGQGAVKQQKLALTTTKNQNSNSDQKNLIGDKIPSAGRASTCSQSSSSAASHSVSSSDTTPTHNSSTAARHTPSPNTGTNKDAAKMSSSTSKSQKSTSRPSTPDEQRQMPNSTISTQQAKRTRLSYKPKTVSEVWGSDCDDTSEDEEGSSSKSTSKSQKSSVPSTPANQNRPAPAPPPQNTARFTQATQHGTTNQSRPVHQPWGRANSALSKPPEPVTELKVNMKVMARQRTSTWKEATLLEITPKDGGLKYKVQFESTKRLLSGHHIAFNTPPMLAQLKVGVRVVARFHASKTESWLFSAVIMELPDRKNRMRFLVFYDDGNVGYVMLPDMHLVYKPLEKVWEDIDDPAVRQIVEEALQQNHTPTILVLRQGEQLQVRRDENWEDATITAVDCSLVQVTFKADQHMEWLYKGSDRLIYVYKIKKRAQEERNKQGARSDVRPVIKSQTTSTAVTSSTSITTTSTTKTVTSHQTSTAVNKVNKTSVDRMMVTIHDRPARKLEPKVMLKKMSLSDIKLATSSHSRVSSPVSVSPPLPSNTAAVSPPRGSKRPLSSPTQKAPAIPSYNPHRCCPACLDAYRPLQPNPHLGKNPLQIPEHHGFLRITGRRRIEGKVSFHVFYRSPCGRSLSTMAQLQNFLFQTRCDFLSLDMFCLDPFVLVNRATPPGRRTVFFSLADISEGAETVPIPCLNQIDNTRPDLIQYIAKRRPGQGVNINTQLDFLVGCDCTDGCLDRAKCACHQLTIEVTALSPSGPVDEGAGYTHKRLLAPLVTGLYECNPLCRCDPRMCSNRVVQHGTQIRLEMFKTQHKGWGIRCLDDVGKGTFVCTFAGKIVTDELANAEGKVSGDEYFANLDYIEGVEKEKEGYESTAVFSDSDDGNTGPTKKVQCNPTTDSSTDNFDDESDDSGDFDYTSSEDNVSSDASYVAEEMDEQESIPQRNYITRRNAKILKGALGSEMKKLGGQRPGFAVKSTNRKVKPTGSTTTPSKRKESSPCNATRRLFDGEENCYIIDAVHQGNLGRYLNHSCDPNLFVQNVFVDTHDLRFPWVAFFTKKRVRAGTELTWDYSYEVGSVEGRVLLCNCGSQRCTGRLL